MFFDQINSLYGGLGILEAMSPLPLCISSGDQMICLKASSGSKGFKFEGFTAERVSYYRSVSPNERFYYIKVVIEKTVNFILFTVLISLHKVLRVSFHQRVPWRQVYCLEGVISSESPLKTGFTV